MAVRINAVKSSLKYEPMKHRILIVDDERLIADTLALIFHRAGFEVKAVYDGLLGLEAARSFEPCLVLSDVVMPGLDGVSMAMTIQTENPDVVILLFSGQAATSELLGAAERRGFHYELLEKPVPPDEIVRRAEQALARHSHEKAVS